MGSHPAGRVSSHIRRDLKGTPSPNWKSRDGQERGTTEVRAETEASASGGGKNNEQEAADCEI